MTKIYYTAGVTGFCEIETTWDIEEDSEYIAQDAAGDHYENNDGLESTWPIEISIYLEVGREPVAVYLVDLEMEPVFSVAKKVA
ncbi:MAG: hypothetical protein RPR40_07990 [Bermanella sp.]